NPHSQLPDHAEPGLAQHLSRSRRPVPGNGGWAFLLRQFLLTIPRELWDAALIDGCSRRRFLVRILAPLVRPAFATLAIYAFLSAWNQYLWPLLVINSQQIRTVQIGLAILQSQEAVSWTS